MTPTTLDGGAALVEALAAHGVDLVFGIPGTHNLAIYSALADSAISHVTPRHEQGAGYAADGYARVSGRPGVCVTTTGPAILNATAAAAQAYSDSIPVLFIAPGMPANHPSGHNGLLHEVRDQFTAMASVVGHAQRVTTVADIPLAVAQCFSAMTGARPRPAYLEIPLDLLEQAEEVRPSRPVTASSPAAPPAEVARAADLIRESRRPLIVAGGGCSGAADALRVLAERLQAPVVTTANGKGVLPEDHELSLGAGVHLAVTRDVVAEADLVVAVGTELSPADWWYGPIPAVDLVRIDIDAHAAQTNAEATVAVVGDAHDVLTALAEQVPERDRTEDAASWRARLEADAEQVGTAYLGLTDTLDRVLDRDAIVAADQSMSCYYGLLGNLPLHTPRSFLFPAGLGTLGFALPAAIGAKLAAPERQVVAVLGDGGVMFSVAELATAAEAGLALPVVIVDNHGYGEIRNEMIERDGRTLAVDLPSPQFADLAVALGCHGVSAESMDDVARALATAFDSDRPTLIHVREDVTSTR